MRVIGGSLGGRRLASVGKGDARNALRPTSDRLREALFNVLEGGRYGDVIEGAQVLDLFAGTGALGIEALSRGAAFATFVEAGRVGQGLIRENLSALDLHSRAKLIPRDATRLTPAPRPASLVFLDPPYGRGFGGAALASARRAGWLAPESLVVWEEASEMSPPDGFTLVESRSYSGTVFSFLRPSKG
ncbi:16S rRNA (guanine(966)-N(2))-methyltransferase RsmD [Pseudaestuariivita sp.]|uniref:16S rRNA (guanine(966)-N(2))-methyltransferase RsmD n=1 Tax=Pseudaestuariivita sp. TaxID=2211669 RepID=UPI00405861C0